MFFMQNKPFQALLIGAGNRGAEVYGEWIYNHPDQLKFTAITKFTDSHYQQVKNKAQFFQNINLFNCEY